MANEQTYVERDSSSPEIDENEKTLLPGSTQTSPESSIPTPKIKAKRIKVKPASAQAPPTSSPVSEPPVSTPQKKVRIRKAVSDKTLAEQTIPPVVLDTPSEPAAPEPTISTPVEEAPEITNLETAELAVTEPIIAEQIKTESEAPPVLPKAPITKNVKLTIVKSKTKKVDANPVAKKPVVKKNVLATTFQLRFNTTFGQTLYVTGNHELLGNNDISKAVPLAYYNDDFWTVEIELPKTAEPITYKYVLRGDDGVDTIEWGNDKIISPALIKASELVLIDSWNYPGYYENTFYTKPFKEVLFKQHYTPFKTSQPASFTHTFKVKAPLLTHNQLLCICGNVPELGGWSKPENFIMNRLPGEDWWTFSVNLSKAQFPIAYKYGVYNISDKTLVQFESGNNRVIADLPADKQLTIVSDCFVNLPNNIFKAAGVAIPVFSLRSKTNLGIGEFNDLKLLVDWAKQTGLKVIQVLPVNDTTATHTISDSYPYAAISAFALHPLYLHLPNLVGKKNKYVLDLMQKAQQELSQSNVVDYDGVVKLKFDIIKQIFPSQKLATFKKEDFRAFYETNAHWLVPYATFCYFRDQYGTADFSLWPANNTYDTAQVDQLATPPLKAKDEISIHYFIQYHLHLQLKEASEYAHQNGIILKGDIAIGIYRNSCDAWQQPKLYNMDQQAGAPPDDFAVKGQNWGFPTYNWERMAADGFSWWKQRFTQMKYYFDAFRIDHILGFFRIWSIPMDAVEGIMGQFVPALPVHITEFHHNDIWFDLDRYTKPFINDHILSVTFGDDKDHVTSTFLKASSGDFYEFLPAFDTQRKVEEHFSKHNNANFKKQGLFDLLSNVILFEKPGSNGTEFHFRIAMDSTSSFQYFDDGTKERIRHLYINYFYRRQDHGWMREAMAKLPELKQSTDMLIFGEDLGMVPECVPGVMKNLGILSLEIQRMPKDPSREFFHPNDAPYLSVVTPSTHDMSTIRGWWEENPNTTQRFYNRELGQYGRAPFVCEPWINKTIVLQHLHSPAMWSIFQLQDLLGMSEEIRRENPQEERINIPANSKHHWVYKMHLNLEDLLQQDQYNAQLHEHVSASGR